MIFDRKAVLWNTQKKYIITKWLHFSCCLYSVALLFIQLLASQKQNKNRKGKQNIFVNKCFVCAIKDTSRKKDEENTRLIQFIWSAALYTVCDHCSSHFWIKINRNEFIDCVELDAHQTMSKSFKTEPLKISVNSRKTWNDHIQRICNPYY